MKRPALIFDIDGTLWDSRQIVADGYNHHLASIGRQDLFVTADYLKGLFGKTMTEIADVMLASIPIPERYEVLTACMEEEHRFLEKDPCHIAFPGVVETLAKLKKDYRLFIVSNAQCGYPELMMEKLSIRHLFEGWLCFGDTGTCKGETIRTLMKRCGISSACYIGDTQGDADASELAGIPFLWAAYGFGNVEKYAAKLDHIGQLLEL